MNRGNFTFGVDYYPEHWPQERMPKDVRLMKELGITVVRMGEFAWHKMQPSEDADYDFEWLEKAVNALGEQGIMTVLGTPTAAPPAWMVRKYPQILPVGPDGIQRGFGGRHHDCQSNLIYREFVEGIVTAMAKRFADNKYVVGWQIDNEFGNSHEDLCMCDSCARSFRDWLANKYGNIDGLNKAWGTYFWSQEYNEFSEITPPRRTACGYNPSQLLDWKRFHSDLIVDFTKFQADIIRDICPKDHFITHNCMGFYDVVDYYALSQQLDFVAHDLYPTGYWRDKPLMDPEEIGAELDVIRGITGQSFWIMEQQSSIPGWEFMGKAPAPGQIPLWAVDSIAHGADTIVFFRWRSCTVGTEQYWHGILPHSGRPGRVYEEIKGLIDDVGPTMERYRGTVPDSRVGIVYSYEQKWSISIQPNGKDVKYLDQLMAYYRVLRKKNVPTDFVNPNGDFSQYAVLVAPIQYIMTPDLAEKYMSYVENGGRLIVTMRSGVKDEYNICMSDRALPGDLSELLGIEIYDYDSLYTDEKVAITLGGKKVYGQKWADVITLKKAASIGQYRENWYKNQPAVTVNSYGKGRAYYVGTEPTEEMAEVLTNMLMKAVGIKSNADTDLKLPEGVELCVRDGSMDRFYFLLNHTDTAKKVRVPSDWELLAGEKVGDNIPGFGYRIYQCRD